MIDILAGLPEATPDALLSERLAAGHTQAQAAAAAGLGSRVRWTEYERGTERIDPLRRAVYLLVTGQHPGLELSVRQS